MSRLLIASLALSVLFGTINPEACGDKFLRVGRGPRFAGYAAAYPARILIYHPPKTDPAFLQQMKTMLSDAGHTPILAERSTRPLQISAAAFDVVITSYSDALQLRDQFRVAAKGPGVLPVLKKKVAATAQQQFPYLLVEGSTEDQALEQIDRFMEQRRKDAISSAPPTGS